MKVIDSNGSVRTVIYTEVSSVDVKVNVNSNPQGTISSSSGIDINVTDGVGSVTPDSVTITGNTIEIEVPAGGTPTSVLKSSTLLKTGQTTSYRTGDDGDFEAGRATDFLTLNTIPVHADGSATANTTTNRFTDELGGQTYTNDIVIDWSTYDNVGETVLGYYRLSLGTMNWDDGIDTCLAHSAGTFTSGWRMWNLREMQNVLTNGYLNNGLEYAPFNQIRRQTWTSTTNATGTTQAYYSDRFLHIQTLALKTTILNVFAVRTFTVSGTTLT